MNLADKLHGCLLGLAVGDAAGTTVEFKERGSFPPLTDMIGGGPFRLLPGQWTDDTSLALCLATSLIECNGFDARDQMKRYCRWEETGYLSSTGKCFDIGLTTASSLARFRESGEPYSGSTHPRQAGNGSIMRLAPIPMFYYQDITLAEHYAAESSKTTHGSPECLDACRLLARMICHAFAGKTKQEILMCDSESFAGEEKIVAIAKGAYQQKSIDQINSSGYVVESVEAALWCFFQTENFRDAVLMAANLGDDADTTAAVCGQIAGAYYGAQQIPSDWLDKLTMRDEITKLSEQIFSFSLREA
jgi:ADP-ribosyl-[dinitrogen reductase] hydrolase